MKTIDNKIDDLIKEVGREKIIEYLNADNKQISYTNIKTFEDACEILPFKYEFSVFNDIHDKHLTALLKLEHIYSAINFLNNDWKPDWLDGNQYKYWPWFKAVSNSNKSESGSSVFVFSNTNYNYDNWNTNVSSRLSIINFTII